MTSPSIDPQDIGVLLGLGDSLDLDKASLIVDLITDEALTVVSPLPGNARTVILRASVRAYANIDNKTQGTEGPFNASFGALAGGLFLSNQDRASLLRGAGVGVAFSVDTLPSGVACVQTVTVVGSPSSGTFKLGTLFGSTISIDIAATYATVQAALATLPMLAGVTVSGLPGGWIVAFPVTLGPVAQMTATATLTGGTNAAVLTGVTTVGVFPPGGGLPWWDSDTPGAR